METHLEITGALLIILSLLHIAFPYYFKWKIELAALNLINRQMMQVHTFFISITLFLMGLLCLSTTGELLNSGLGKKICLGFFVFWVIRLVIQLFGYSNLLWRGKRFETSIHIIFTLLWSYFSIIFLMSFLSKQ